jgi:hypothetical protein
MKIWLFSSNTLKNIEVAKDKLLWGFWDREKGSKQRKNWRDFIRLFNKIEPFDIAVFQTTDGEIHAIGIIKKTYYDDQTPVWPEEINEDKILFPWRVSFCNFIFSETPFTKFFAKISNYIDGYGIGELSPSEFQKILQEVQEKHKVLINYDTG